MSTFRDNVRAALTGILFAVVGFSYALATSAGVTDGGAAATARAVIGGTNLHFTNPKLSGGSGDFDLGDAVAGSIFSTRFVRAAGGIPPYSFTSPSSATNPLSTVRPELTLLSNGELFLGSGGALSSAPGPIRFAVQVVDSLSGSANVANGQFRITLVGSNQFRFGIGSLGSAAAGHSYSDSLVVINGNTLTASGTTPGKGITFSIDTINGPNGTTLEANGLSLSASDGVIFGKPISAGAITFVAHATDAVQNKALSRDGTREGQPIILNVEAGSLNSDIVSSGIKISGATAGTKDKIIYGGNVNLRGQALSSFSGKNLVLKISNYTSPTAVFNSNGGTAVNSTTASGTLGRSTPQLNFAGPTIKVKLSNKGQIRINITNETLASLLLPVPGSSVLSGGGLLAVGLSIVDPKNAGTPILGSEILLFNAGRRGGKNGSFALSYKLGDLRSGNTSPGGNFLMTGVLGKDDTRGVSGTTVADAWKANFIATPAGKGSLQNGVATVSVGTFTDVNTLNVINGKTARGTGPKDPHISKLILSDKGKGSLQTGPLPGQNPAPATAPTGPNTGIPTASVNGSGRPFPFSVDISLSNGSGSTTDLNGELAVFSNRTAWSDKNPNK